MVQVIAVRRKLFPDLSEDCWLLYCDGYGECTNCISLTILNASSFARAPPNADLTISLNDWRTWGCRLRPFLLPPGVRETYREFAESPHSVCLGSVARMGIGYVTGANDFFHLRPSEAERAGVPDQYLHPCVRNGRCLAGQAINNSTVEAWRRRDEAILLLRLSPSDSLPISVKRYLDSAAGRTARLAYKCRSREPWYVVPDVSVPDAFLSYMSGVTPSLVANHAKCVGTNSVHVVKLNGTMDISELQDRWRQPLTQLSCELEGHPLGGGMLKLEPREAGKIVLSPRASPTRRQAARSPKDSKSCADGDVMAKAPPFANGLASSGTRRLRGECLRPSGIWPYQASALVRFLPFGGRRRLPSRRYYSPSALLSRAIAPADTSWRSSERWVFG